jgi:tRNA A22 N-methylase
MFLGNYRCFLRSIQCTTLLYISSCNPLTYRWPRSIGRVQLSVFRNLCTGSDTTDGHHINDDWDLILAKNSFNVLARKSKSWRRLGPIIDLALDFTNNNFTESTRSLCDVGTDHGLLAVSLATTNRFHHVLGVDVSSTAMREGALKLYDEIRAYRNKTASHAIQPTKLKIDFRISDGLQNVLLGEADIVCIAGMGVHTMTNILMARKQENGIYPNQLLLDEVNTQCLILQPTNSRPRLLMHLYNHLQDIGWGVQTERIEFISSRWYITIVFERTNNSVKHIPGVHLRDSNKSNVTDIGVFLQWVVHHKNWIRSDSLNTGTINPEDVLWLNEFDL